MADILTRLRSGPLSGDPVFEEAADEIDRLRKALAFYGDAKNWNDGGFSNKDGPNVLTLVPSSIDNDRGKTARAALDQDKGGGE